MKKPSKRSPLRDRPLRYAGQSLQEQINDLISNLINFLFVGAFFIFYALMDWSYFLNKTTPKPWLTTIIAFLVIVYSAYRFIRGYQKLTALKLGRDGEKIVAENLDILKQKGDTILHDIVGNGFNIDHVILSRHGIFLVETKTRSKSTGGNPKVKFDGEKVQVDGLQPDRDPIQQVTALANWLKQTLHDSTGKSFPVRPVIVFPGWYVEPMPKGLPVWVLNPKALPAFIQNQPLSISDDDLQLVTFHLIRYIRTQV